MGTTTVTNSAKTISYPIQTGDELLAPSIRPSLLLDFANAKTLDPRITFTRASTATRVNEKGLIEVVASGAPRFDHDAITGECKGLLIEEQRTNLLTYSENFDNAAWIKSNVTVTANATTAPDGTLTADKLVESAASGFHTLYESYTPTSASITWSLYVKSAEHTTIRLNSYEAVTPKNPIVADFDLVALTAAPVSASTTSATIVPVGGGWFRISATTNAAALVVTTWSIFTKTGTNYTGDGASGIYIWGAQLEAGSFATSYIPSAETFTSRATTGTFIGSNGLIQSAAINTARMSYNPLNLSIAPKLLLEDQATNLLTYSEQFDNAAWQGSATVTSNVAFTPDGLNSGDTLTCAADIDKYQAISSLTVGATYTASIFLKSGTVGSLRLRMANSNTHADVDLGTKTVVVTSGSGAASIQDVGYGWQRVSLTYTQVGAVELFTIRNNSGGTGYWQVWGAQLEVGSLTSYIPTTTAQVTRGADISTSAQATRLADSAVMTGTNFSSWYRQDEGVFLAKFSFLSVVGQYPMIYSLSDGSGNNLVSAYRNNDGIFFDSLANNTNQQYCPLGTVVANTSYLTINALKQNDYAVSKNGGVIVSDASGLLPNLSDLKLGNRFAANYLNGHISKLAYFPKRLSNLELQVLSQ